jgi:hypothetical protein
MPVGQDEKAAVIDDQLEAVILMAEVSADPVISGSALQSGGGKAQKGYPLIAPEGNVPEGFADFRQGTQVMMLLHQSLIALLFGRTNGPDKNLSQIQNGHPQMKCNYAPYNSSGGHCPFFVAITGFVSGFHAE